MGTEVASFVVCVSTSLALLSSGQCVRWAATGWHPMPPPTPPLPPPALKVAAPNRVGLNLNQPPSPIPNPNLNSNHNPNHNPNPHPNPNPYVVGRGGGLNGRRGGGGAWRGAGVGRGGRMGIDLNAPVSGVVNGGNALWRRAEYAPPQIPKVNPTNPTQPSAVVLGPKAGAGRQGGGV